MLLSILWKNWLLKRANTFGTLGEIFIPVLFMALLILIKSITSVYNSPNVAYYCGQTFPWFYTPSIVPGEVPAVSQCLESPQVCSTKNYYQSKFSFYVPSIGQTLSGYSQYGS